jgi:hypothetical protein
MSLSRTHDALALARRLFTDFTDLGMARDAAFVAIDIAELLSATGNDEEVTIYCAHALAYFRSEHLLHTDNARAALAYVSDAASVGRLSPNAAHRIRTEFRPPTWELDLVSPFPKHLQLTRR